MPKARGMRRYFDDGESVRLETRPHGAALARPLARTLVVAAAGGALVVAGSPRFTLLGVAGTVLLALAALGALRAVVAWDRTTLVVTTRKLLVVHGLVRRRTAAAELRPGDAVEVDQSLLGRLLGYGTVVAGELEVPYVPDAGRLVRGR